MIGRKNFLFANTSSGARASSVYFSLIETAKANNPDPYRYLTWVLKTASTKKMKDAEQVKSLLPMNAPAECRVAMKG